MASLKLSTFDASPLKMRSCVFACSLAPILACSSSLGGSLDGVRRKAVTVCPRARQAVTAAEPIRPAKSCQTSVSEARHFILASTMRRSSGWAVDGRGRDEQTGRANNKHFHCVLNLCRASVGSQRIYAVVHGRHRQWTAMNPDKYS